MSGRPHSSSPAPAWRRWVVPLLVASTAAGGVACPAGGAGQPPARALPAHEGERARWFDDTLSLRLANPALTDGQHLLAVRAAEADTVALGRLETINERSRGAHSSFELVFALEKTIAGLDPAPSFVLDIGPDNPSHGMIRSRRLELIGRRAVLFLKWFRGESESRIHARVEPDEPSVHDAIIAARM